MVMPHPILLERTHICSRLFLMKLFVLEGFVRILTYLSPFDSRNLMLIKKHGLDWLATSLILIVLCENSLSV